MILAMATNINNTPKRGNIDGAPMLAAVMVQKRPNITNIMPPITPIIDGPLPGFILFKYNPSTCYLKSI